MKGSKSRVAALLTGSLMVLPTAGYGGVGTLADQPLWMGSSVKHNIMLAIDDSGSMDFETLMPTNDGALWWDESTQSYVNSTKGVPNFEADYKDPYLFPIGISSTSTTIAPFRVNAFVRSSSYNKAYYDPSVTYLPWPSYGGYSFANQDPKAAKLDPLDVAESGTLDLTTSHSGKFYTYLGGWCNDNGGKCGSSATRTITYYPATYYVKDTTSTYKFYTSGGPSVPVSSQFTTSNSLLFESDDTTDPAVEHNNKWSSYNTGSPATDASGNKYSGTNVSGLSETGSTVPRASKAGQVRISFSGLSGRVAIWFRVWWPGDSSDSFWVNLKGYDRNDIDEHDKNTWALDKNNNDWYPWKDHATNQADGNFVAKKSAWQWVKWAEVNITSASDPQLLRIRGREDGAFLDQVLVTTNTGSSAKPVGELVLGSGSGGGSSGGGTYVTRSCDPASVLPIHYEEFEIDPSRFVGVDAIGPDGACLKKVEIKSGNTFPSGRTYSAEIQNFANWFSYYRRRNQAMRGGLASAFQGLNGIRAGMFWINTRNDVTMLDLDDSTQLNTFLKNHYTKSMGGGTPLRKALEYAGNQFKRTDANAPVTSECQKNFTLLFTDGFNNNNASDVSSTIGDADKNEGAPYADSYERTLADIAMYFYKNNIRPDLPAGQVAIPANCDASKGEDCNKNLHMNTFTAGLGAKGSIYGVTHSTVADAYANPPTWPNVNTGKRDEKQLDDLYHAAVNGRGDMFNADTPVALRTALSDAVRSILKVIGSSSGVTFNTASLQTDTLLYSATFNSTSWAGELEAKSLDTDGKVKSTAWKASTILDARNLATDPRVILTYKSDAANPDGVAFQWANLPAIGQDDLNYKGTSSGDGLGQKRLDWLRGDRSNEATLFRSRSSRLGDIVNSSPVVVGKPAMSWPDKAPFGDTNDRYSEFKNGTGTKYTSVPKRNSVIYVGANDGMLHGFNAKSGTDGGKEVLAYVPAALYSTDTKKGLRYLTDPNYQHRYYVDLSPVASDVYIKNEVGGSRSWRTILVGGLRAGGRGLFALDVTNPTDFSENPTNAAKTVLWEFTANDDADLGYITEPPVVAMMNNSKWAVIFGNGYGSTSGSGGTQGTGKIFILFIEEGLDGKWTVNSDYIKLDTKVVAGVSGVAVADTDGDMIADRLYAGDDAGNMWAFDVSSSNTNSWGPANGSETNPDPLFTAKDSSGNAQPITAAPGIQRHATVKTDSTNDPNILVTFGTGKYLSNGDPADTQTQSFYAVWDKGNNKGNKLRSNLHRMKLTDSGSTRKISNAGGSSVNWSTDYGFYFDFDTVTGERLVHKPLLRNDYAIFVTTIPESSACAGGGSSWLMVVALTDGLTPANPVIDMDGDGDVDSNDAISSGKKLDDINNKPAHLSKKIYTSKSDQSSGTGSCGAGVNCTTVDLGEKSIQTGRLGWHELFEK
ncbi:MAG: hypothetical protein D6758_13720 [Gammaproteobacteria bacterium]|nr:MAG: hypothetical protein D6758_13720 [Gammaproteobacteria bacterium]